MKTFMNNSIHVSLSCPKRININYVMLHESNILQYCHDIVLLDTRTYCFDIK